MIRRSPRLLTKSKEVPLNSYRFSIGVATVVLLVALRLALGCHFLYEGVWKFTHPGPFAAETEGFLSGARGPLAGLFFRMVPDIDGRERLSGDLNTVKIEVKDAAGKPKTVETKVVINEARTRQYEALRDRFVARNKNLKDEADKVCQQQLLGAEQYLGDNWDEIDTHFKAMERFNHPKEPSPATAFQKKRDRDTMVKLRGEAKVWLADLDARVEAYKTALRDLVPPEESMGRDPLAASWNPFAWTQMEQIRFAITWGLTAIGVCLMLGLCTRPAALGGGIFMLCVVMSQPSFPGVIPPDPPQLGHALLVNKDFIEMLALFLISTTAVGRWGGLDYFLENFIVGPFLSKTVCRTRKEG